MKMIVYHVRIRSTDQFKLVGLHGKKMTEMRSIVWRTTVFGYAFAEPSPYNQWLFLDIAAVCSGSSSRMMMHDSTESVLWRTFMKVMMTAHTWSG